MIGQLLGFHIPDHKTRVASSLLEKKLTISPQLLLIGKRKEMDRRQLQLQCLTFVALKLMRMIIIRMTTTL